ncbi:SDR family oxidoreductase [Bacillus aquiflavi]|uniref:SDR family oxidoreductase n=1 Tax=Bacillus aquiflavi TaxID=2672567 RepID=A0A6B3VWM4_9BACI|nr:SDR family oxidoreductase [Bacillus aquiflavi]MBA4537392.1 SDR family oxidoreductase [Bacillus aquiflavi]NEY81648.1 SDR family oxidoreductase [Bacillus aquiflavi]UAC49209.1 SDR family oxidoreductase [Bacillus aquiflavi]
MDLNLNGKVALVVASSQGLGRAIAEELVKEGANVMITSRDREKLQIVKQEIEQLGSGKVTYIKTDITNPEEIEQLIKATNEQFGKLDILINNAGGPPAGSFDSFADSDWQQAFELNLLSYIRMIKHALPLLRKQGGKIVNIASSSIKEPIPGLILSNTFRTAIVGLSKSLAQELAADHILVNTVAPGRIATDRITYLDEVNAKKQGITRVELEQKVKTTIPLGRYGTPEEFAKVVAFLASDGNTYMTGSTFLVDGGMVKAI